MRDAVLARELHSGEDSAGLGAHEERVPRQSIGAERLAHEGASTGRENHRARPNGPSPAVARDARGASDFAVRSQKQMQRRTVVEQAHAEFQKPSAHDLHVIGAAQSSTIEDSSIVAGKCVTPFGQSAELHMGLVDHSLDPVGARQPEASRKSALDHRSAGRP